MGSGETMGRQRSPGSPLEGFKGANRPGALSVPEKQAAAARRGFLEPACACGSPQLQRSHPRDAME